jgi:adenylyltransferase/sulfurtransferase
MSLSPEQERRYARHLILPEIGAEGQRKLLNASVLIVGSGGLGSPIALYLAAAGVGRLGVMDFDTVDPSNLQRQVLFDTTQIGKAKVAVAAERLTALNHDVEVIAYPDRLTRENALERIHGFDYVVDGTDNFPARYLINDACVLSGKPYIHGSIFSFDGQVTIFGAPDGPCYRCMLPVPPAPDEVPTGSDVGVLGVLPGVIGLIQATETIKLILGIGRPLIGRFLLFDSLGMRFREIKIAKRQGCPMCGENREVHSLIDYDAFCGLRPLGASAITV